MTMQFSMEGRDFCLQGINTFGLVNDVECKSLKSSFVKLHGLFLQITQLQHLPLPNLLPIEVQKILDKFSSVFVEPMGLPHRDCDHQILLMEGSNLVVM